MMTQRTVEAQAALKNFDALNFELKHSSDFEQSQKIGSYFEPSYQIDSDKDIFGSLYRVWDGQVLIGTFHQKQGRWIAYPYYKNRQYLRLDYSLSRTFRSNESAIRYITRCYES